jgi:hypothetical protein
MKEPQMSNRITEQPFCQARVSSRFIVITYLFYIVFYEAMIWGGCAYVVFFLNRSGWWFLLAVLLSSAAYSPAKWHRLLTGKIDKDE